VANIPEFLFGLDEVGLHSPDEGTTALGCNGVEACEVAKSSIPGRRKSETFIVLVEENRRLIVSMTAFAAQVARLHIQLPGFHFNDLISTTACF